MPPLYSPAVPGGKALEDPINERIRARLRALMTIRGWDQKAAGKGLDVTQQTVSNFLAKKTGASLHLAWEIARTSGISMEELLTGERGARHPTFRELPGWKDGESEARRMFAHLPAHAFEVVGGWSGETVLQTVTPLIIGSLAENWWRSALAGVATATEEKSGERVKKARKR